MLFSSVDRTSVFSYFLESRDSDLEKHRWAGEKSTSDISPKAQPSHFTSSPCTHGHALHGFATGLNIDFHLAFCKYWDTIWINVLKMYFRHWLTFSTFVVNHVCLVHYFLISLSLHRTRGAVCPTAVTTVSHQSTKYAVSLSCSTRFSTSSKRWAWNLHLSEKKATILLSWMKPRFMLSLKDKELPANVKWFWLCLRIH